MFYFRRHQTSLRHIQGTILYVNMDWLNARETCGKPVFLVFQGLLEMNNSMLYIVLMAVDTLGIVELLMIKR